MFYVFLAICLFSVVFTLFSKKDVDGAAELFGIQMRVVTTDSMAKCDQTDVSAYKIKSLPPRTMVFTELVPSQPQEAQAWYDSLKVGDVLTFRYVYASQVTVTHRITSITPKDGGGYIIRLAGDNKNANTGQLYQTIDTSDLRSPNYVLGKVVAKSYLLGFFVSLLKTNMGIVCILIVPCGILAALEIIKLTELLKKQRQAKMCKEETPENTEEDEAIEEAEEHI